jgi:ADP-ribose pyrophosphatase YjhB (NUDIX family)
MRGIEVPVIATSGGSDVASHTPVPPAAIRPRAAASAAIFRGRAVLLAERGKGPPGVWSLPGGHIEAGETAMAAAAREVAEETGIAASILGLADVVDVILRDEAGEVSAHYVLAVYYGVAGDGLPVAASDCRTARFVALDDLDDYALTGTARRIIDWAARRIERDAPRGPREAGDRP